MSWHYYELSLNVNADVFLLKGSFSEKSASTEIVSKRDIGGGVMWTAAF